ncbi:hypothetical protein BDN71DRAFT_1430531 [Pleurotus eryngii]|nr:hypothetical protein BDN71DRAFT_1430531 [Pleurotus eryngii]
MYAPSIGQTLDWYHISQLRLPTYRFRHNARFHPYIRYVETDPLMSTIDEHDSPRAALPPPPPPPAYLANEVPQAQEFDGDREIEVNEEAVERRRFIQVILAITQNLKAAAERIIRRQPKCITADNVNQAAKEESLEFRRRSSVRITVPHI